MTSGKIQNSRVMLFTGAGASAGLGMPTTVQFIRILRERWTGAEILLPRCLEKLINDKKIEYREDLDSELVRDWLIHLRDSRKAEDETTSESLNIDSIEQSIREFDKLIRNAYGMVDHESAYSHYMPFLDVLARHDIDYLPVFSTCYDLTLESLSQCAESDWRIELHPPTDFKSPHGKSLEKAFEPGCKILHLFKLHGSAAWKKNNSTGEIDYSSTGISETAQRHYNELMIYPTVEDFSPAGEEPFSQYYEIFKRSLNQNEKALCIVIGYSFRDRIINGIFTPAIDNGLRVLVLDNALEYKTLAARLGISDIKHKMRIEKMEFGNWNSDKVKLLSDVMSDEIRRTG